MKCPICNVSQPERTFSTCADRDATERIDVPVCTRCWRAYNRLLTKDAPSGRSLRPEALKPREKALYEKFRAKIEAYAELIREKGEPDPHLEWAEKHW